MAFAMTPLVIESSNMEIKAGHQIRRRSQARGDDAKAAVNGIIQGPSQTREQGKPTLATNPTKAGHNLDLSSSAKKLSNPTVFNCVGQVKCAEILVGV